MNIDATREAVAECGGLVGASDIARRWGLSKQRVAQLIASASFPEPLAGHGAPARWLAYEVDEWREERLADARSEKPPAGFREVTLSAPWATRPISEGS